MTIRHGGARLWITAVLTAVLAAPLPARGQEGGGDAVRQAVVQVFVQARPPDPAAPWQGTGVESLSGSGVVVEGNRILTVAHLVVDALTVEVKLQGQTRKYPAAVTAVAHECDLALLAVEDPVFFRGAVPLPLGSTPRIEDPVRVYGFPEGGDSVSATSGIVSRVEVNAYSHSWRELLLVQVDAAINPGNSGGPVVAGGRLAGIAMQMLSDAENIGYMVPASVVRHLLVDLGDGRYDGFPTLGARFQSVENPALRRYLGMGEDETGALVTAVGEGGSADGILQPGDVLTAVGGVPIAEDLTVPAPEGFRVHFGYLVQSRQAGEKVSLGILRGGKRMERTAVLRDEPVLVPGGYGRGAGGFFLVGGLLFRALTMDYALYATSSVDECYASDLDYYAHFHNLRTPARRQVVILSRVLPAPVNRGYQDLVDTIVATVQGRAPADLADLVRIVEQSREPFLRVVMETGETVVLDLERARKDGERILKTHNVAADRSPDLR